MLNTEAFLKAASGAIEHYLFDHDIDHTMVFNIWNVKVLDHRKGIFAADGDNELLFEVTYNGLKNEMYLDAYSKDSNKVISLN